MDLDTAASAVRQTLGYLKPSEKFTELESIWP
jgi:hypothetical protein